MTVTILFLVLAAACLVCSLSAAGQCRDETQTVTFHGVELSGQQLRQLQENLCLEEQMAQDGEDALQEDDASAAVAAWREEKEQWITGSETQGTVQASVITVSGDPSLLSPLFAGLDKNDTDGCLLDEETAYKLFGSVRVVGKQVVIGERSYCVRGILKAWENVVVTPDVSQTAGGEAAGTIDMQANGTEENSGHTQTGNEGAAETTQKWQQLSVALPTGADRNVFVQTFCAKYGIAESAYLDMALYANTAQLGSMLLPLSVCLAAICTLFRAAVKEKEKWFVRVAWVLGGLGLLFLTLLFLKSQLAFSADVFPTKWSDFSFWTEKREAFLQQIDTLRRADKTLLQLRQQSLCIQALTGGVGALLLCFISSGFFYKNSLCL